MDIELYEIQFENVLKIFIRKLRNIDFGWKNGTVIFEIDVFSVIFLKFFFFEASYKRRIIFQSFIRKLTNI